MDVSRMVKKATSSIIFMAITALLGLTLLLDVFTLISIFGERFEFQILIPYILGIAADVCLLLYALNSHGTKGSKISAYLYFIITAASSLISIINQKRFGFAPGGVTVSALFIVITLSVVACLFFKVRGLPVIAIGGLVLISNVISVVRTMVEIGAFFGLVPFISLVIPVFTFPVACYLVATDK